MPVKPSKSNVKLTNTSSEVLNAIRNEQSTNYRNRVPVALQDADSIKAIGAVIMDNVALQNEFLNALINRIGRVLITSKNFYNPLAMFKQGMLEFGETVEEIFVDLAMPHTYNVDTAENEVFKREIPDVRSAFHHMNYQKFYKVTIQRNELKQAFLSVDGVIELAEKIANSMYSAMNYDEFQVTKYLIAIHAYQGKMNPVTIPTIQSGNMNQIVSTIKGISNKFVFPSRAYNLAGVMTNSEKENQIILVNSEFDAVMDVEVLATAFNMERAQFMGQRVLIDSFGALDIERLAKLFEGDSTYHEFSAEELKQLDTIPAIILDRSWFMIFDNLLEFTELQNGQGMYWNNWLHTWKTFSVSPFAQNALFVPGTPAVKTVTVSPATVSSKVGQTVQFSATVDTDFYAGQGVNWTSNSANVIMDRSGLAHIEKGATGAVTITATSVFDPSKKGTATLTVS